MADHDYITVSAYAIMDGWALKVRWRDAEDAGALAWHGLGTVLLQRDGQTIRDTLEAMAEELFNLAALTETDPTAWRTGPAPSGDL